MKEKDSHEFDGFDEDDMEGIYETLIMTDNEGQELEFVVIDSVEENGVTYLLVVEAAQADNEDSDAVILKETRENENEFIYDIVEEEAEFYRIAALFQDNGDEYTIEYE